MKINLPLCLLLLIVSSRTIAQNNATDKNCCNFKKRISEVNKQTVDLFFDELGRPLTPVGYVPYGSQVNVIAKNVNPLKTLPSSTISFATFNTTRQSDVPDIAGMFGIGKAGTTSADAATTPVQAKKSVVQMKEFSASILNSTDAVLDFSRSMPFSAEFAPQISNITAARKKLDDAKSKSDKDQMQLANLELQKHVENLEKQLMDKAQKLKDTATKLAQQVESSLEKINTLEEQIKKLQNQEQWGTDLKGAYKKLVIDINAIVDYFSLGNSVDALFNQQFLDSANTKANLQQAVNTRLPGSGKDSSAWLRTSHGFLISQMNDVMEQYGIVADNYRRINELPVKDSFGSDKPTDITVKNKNNKTAKVTIPALQVIIDREPLYKEQMEYAATQAAIFRNAKTRDSMLVYSDTLMLRVLYLMQQRFYQPIKTFQANADEITIKLPYTNAQEYKIKTYCHFKVEGSTGLFVHVLNTGDKYKTIKVAEDSLQIVRQRKDNVLYSFGFLAHFYNYDPRRRFNIGGSIGFNIPITNQANTGFLQGVAGLSFHTTSIEKLSFTLGMSIRKGQRLNTYNLNTVSGKDVYTFKNKNEIEPTYDPVAQVGFFFGLCYSLFGGGKTNDVQ